MKSLITSDRARTDGALVKALARAHRWQRLLESGECCSITELATAEKIDLSYLCRVLRLTLLAPEIIEAILYGRQPEEATLPALMKGFPAEWEGSAFEFGAQRQLARRHFAAGREHSNFTLMFWRGFYKNAEALGGCAPCRIMTGRP